VIASKVLEIDMVLLLSAGHCRRLVGLGVGARVEPISGMEECAGPDRFCIDATGSPREVPANLLFGSVGDAPAKFLSAENRCAD
jgi:hypothetical protein